MVPPGEQPLTQQVTEGLRAFDAAQDLVDAAVIEGAGIDATQLHAVDAISRHGGMTAGALAAELDLTTGAVTGVIDRLTRAGLVARRDDPRDRRRVVVELTRAGRAWERRTFGPLAKAWQRQLARYSRAEMTLLLHFLESGRAIAEARAQALRRASRSAQGGGPR